MSTEHRAQSTEHRRFFLKRAFKSLAFFGLPVFFLKKPDKLQNPFQNLNTNELLKESSNLIALNSADAHHSCPKGWTPGHGQGVPQFCFPSG